ncbi:uncharacterized protein SCHCODRAFT_02244189 [Schizophyllum commune H4-8]|uniref:uncharacterized protein n=1 Tax=Schizophyllum commune (strain H4-8 / FGSC 9210) TaxID=578458 RepID=UPI0021604A2D|nr:uncharacterized protein SCHCODRAFT_02244189 [Schizophyllum commune H4-8]KAI5893044.1 hypothetical protein SCHCODRAFT_02244189 [Schizophyllum commune H4-8]
MAAWRIGFTTLSLGGGEAAAWRPLRRRALLLRSLDPALTLPQLCLPDAGGSIGSIYLPLPIRRVPSYAGTTARCAHGRVQHDRFPSDNRSTIGAKARECLC